MRTHRIAVATLALAASLWAAEFHTATIEDPRPVAKGIEFLEAQYGVSITYEDPLYTHPRELLDVTATVSNDSNTASRILIPRGGSASFLYEELGPHPSPEAARIAAYAAVEDLLNHYPAVDGQSLFAIKPTASLLHLEPTRYTNRNGQLEDLHPLLDTIISLPARQRTAADLLTEICDELSNAPLSVGKPTVVVGTVPYSLLASHETSIGATDTSARAVLDRLLGEIDVPLSWQFFYDPTLNWYVLNIHRATWNPQPSSETVHH